MTTETLTRPATFPAGTAAAQALWRGVCQIAAALHRRMQIHASMGVLSDRHLRDIGLTRHEVDMAAVGPLSRDAGEVLARARKSRAASGW